MKFICFFNSFKLREGIDHFPARMIRRVATPLQRRYIENLPNEKLRSNRVLVKGNCIASLTSFPERIDTVYLSVKSLLNQTMPPKEVVLWLSEEQFPDHKLPENLTDLIPYGLKVRYCDNLLGHKKYFYALQEYGNDRVITYDDDLLYPEDSVEKLLETSNRYPNCIICHRGKRIMLNNNAILGYDNWSLNDRKLLDTPSYLMMASTGAGTLYPPNCMPEETFNKANLKELAFTADDLWMKAMSILGQVKVVCTKTPKKTLIISTRRQGVTLAKENVYEHQNDIIFQKLLCEYPEVLNLLQQENGQRMTS